MSRTSTALRRLGVPGLAAATMLAGVPAFIGGAQAQQASNITAITIAPVDGSDTAAAGSCQAYFISATPAAGTTTAGETVNVILTNSLAGDAAADASFCTLPTLGRTPATGTTVTTGGPNGTAPTTATRTDQARFTLGQGAAGTETTGRVVVGITRNQAGVAGGTGTVDILAYSDRNANNTFDVAANEISATRTATFTTGGAAGSNANQDAAAVVEVLAITEDQTNATIAAADDTDTVVQNEARQFRVLVRNGSGDPLNGVVVSYVVGGGANTVTPTTLGATDNNGIATGNVSLQNVGAGNTITFFVNQTSDDATAQTTGRDTDEPADTVAATVVQAQAATTINLRPLADANNTTGVAAYQTSPAINPRNDVNRTFRIDVDNATASANATTGRLLTITVEGADGDETVQCAPGGTAAANVAEVPGTGTGTPAERVDCATTEANPSTTSATDSFVDVIVTNPGAVSGEVLTITATVRGTTTSDAETLTFVAAETDARNIDLTPETTTTVPGQAREFTARVVDARNQPVFNVLVTFTETGPGAFRTGGSTFSVFTNRQGIATADVVTQPAESGTQTVTAAIAATAFTTQAAGTPFGNTRAGNRTDTATNTVIATQTTATPTVTVPPTSPGSATGTVRLSISVERDTIVPTQQGVVTVVGTPNAEVELLAYSRPSTTYRVVRTGSLGADGRIVFRILPGTNTRLFAQYRGATTDALDSPSVVQNVATSLSLTVIRNGSLNYTFQGRILPRRSGQLITLYRVDPRRGEVITAQVRTDATGTWRINRRFVGQGTFRFVARTGQNLTNVAGASNVRAVSIYAGPQR